MEKTCGNCGNSKQTNVYCQISDGLTAGLHSLDERACKRWVEQSDSLEQRCQQLEQLAREMYAKLDAILSPASTKNFRQQLEALGVSLDG